MTRRYSIDDLQAWDARIRETATAFGLSCSDQEFDICDHEQLLGLIAYHGMPSHYPHWSYGKAYERWKTLYDHGVTGLPYELVINTDPCLAYLMQDNSLALQILTMAHVYAHNDFFRNNLTFKASQPKDAVSSFKARADRLRAYREDPSVGIDAVEATLDAAHAIAFHCERGTAIRRLARQRPLARTTAAASQPGGEEREAGDAPDLPENADNLLLFIRDNAPRIERWKKDVLTIVHEQAQYFLPQMQTKIMNEGWASYWHWRILNALELPHDLHMEFLVRHNQVLAPVPGGLNPYHLGLRVWEDIERRYDAAATGEATGPADAGKSGRQKIFEVREEDHDISFLRRYLTRDLAVQLKLFEYVQDSELQRVTRVPSEEDWPALKQTLLSNIATAAIPAIRAVDADFGRWHGLYLRHLHDGRDLQVEHARRVLQHLYDLWGRRVILETRIDGETRFLVHDEDGFELASTCG